MRARVPIKYIRASNLMFVVAFLKLANVAILDYIPTGTTSLLAVLIPVIFVIFGFIVRLGFNWIIFIAPFFMLFPWLVFHTNIVLVFDRNPLAGIIIGLQFLIQVMVIEILLRDSKTAFEERGRLSRHQ